jgi:hypothetical protein
LKKKISCLSKLHGCLLFIGLSSQKDKISLSREVIGEDEEDSSITTYVVQNHHGFATSWFWGLPIKKVVSEVI